jgi:hypothetical protein
MRPYLKNYLKQKGWWCGSSGRVPAKQAKGPKFKTSVWQKKKKRDTTAW